MRKEKVFFLFFVVGTLLLPVKASGETFFYDRSEENKKQNLDSICFVLRMAAFEGDSAKVAEILFNTDVDVDCAFPGELTALGYAVQENHIHVVELLLSMGANPDGNLNRTFPPLNLAIMHGHFDDDEIKKHIKQVVELLLSMGANPDGDLNQTFPPLNLAIMYGYFNVAELLILYGANLDEIDGNGLTPLIRSIQYDQYWIMDMLLHYGADINIGLSDGTSPLHVALIYQDYSMTSRLLDYGANPNIVDSMGFTPLMIAAQFNDTALANLLLYAGADPSIKNREGVSAIDLAIDADAFLMVQLLIANEDKETGKPEIIEFALAKNSTKSIQVLKQSGYVPSLMPIFTSHFIKNSLSFNCSELFFLHQYGLIERRYNTSVSAGIAYRSNNPTVVYLPEDTNSLEYQLKVSRAALFFEIEKRVRLFSFHNCNISWSGSFQPFITWGSFAGSEKKPRRGFVPGIKTGFVFERPNIYFGIHYYYREFNDLPVPNHNIGASFAFSWLKKKYVINKKSLPYELKY